MVNHKAVGMFVHEDTVIDWVIQYLEQIRRVVPSDEKSKQRVLSRFQKIGSVLGVSKLVNESHHIVYLVFLFSQTGSRINVNSTKQTNNQQTNTLNNLPRLSSTDVLLLH
jgi:hypothetical protein